MRDEVTTSLSVTQGTWEEERHARKMLQEHIHAITDVVRKLSRDVQVGLRGDVKNRRSDEFSQK